MGTAECRRVQRAATAPAAAPRSSPCQSRRHSSGAAAAGGKPSEEEGISIERSLVKGNCHLLAFSQLSRAAGTAAELADPRFAELLPRRFPRSCSEVQRSRPIQQAGRWETALAMLRPTAAGGWHPQRSVTPGRSLWCVAHSRDRCSLRTEQDSTQEGPGGSPARLFGSSVSARLVDFLLHIVSLLSSSTSSAFPRCSI